MWIAWCSALQRESIFKSFIFTCFRAPQGKWNVRRNFKAYRPWFWANFAIVIHQRWILGLIICMQCMFQPFHTFVAPISQILKFGCRSKDADFQNGWFDPSIAFSSHALSISEVKIPNFPILYSLKMVTPVTPASLDAPWPVYDRHKPERSSQTNDLV